MREKETENRSINRNRKRERGGILISHLWIRCFKQKNSSFWRLKKCWPQWESLKNFKIIILFYNNLHFVNLMNVSTNDLQMWMLFFCFSAIKFQILKTVSNKKSSSLLLLIRKKCLGKKALIFFYLFPIPFQEKSD